MVADEIRAKIREVEGLPDSRLKTVRLMGLRALLDRTTRRIVR